MKKSYLKLTDSHGHYCL